MESKTLTRNVFITGASGLLGSHLVSSIQAAYPSVYIYAYQGKVENFEQLKTQFFQKPWDVIIHFAGMSHVPDCEQNPELAYKINFLSTVYLGHLVKEANFSGTIIFSSTGLIYDHDRSAEKAIFTETSEIRPKHVYGITKWQSENFLKGLTQYTAAKVVVLRLFNHAHKDQSDRFVLPSVLKQMLQSGSPVRVKVGNLNLWRDFSLVSDFVAAVTPLVIKPVMESFRVINLASGQSRKLKDLVDLIALRLNKVIEYEVDESLLRKNEFQYMVGDFPTAYNKNRSDNEFIDCFLKGE